MKRRLAIITSHPIQYQGPWFRLLAQHPEIDLTVFFCSDHGTREAFDADFNSSFAWSEPLTEGYRHEFVPALGENPRLTFWGLTNPRLITRLRHGAFDAVMPVGWGFATCWLGVAAARASGAKVLLRAESHDGSEVPRPPAKEFARKRILGLLFDQVDAFLAVGSRNAAFYRSFGVAENDIFFTPYAVDNAFFAGHAARLATQRPALRAALGVDDDRAIIVSSGKLIPRKAPLDLLKAFAEAGLEGAARLVFLGDGPLRDEVMSTARSLGIAEHVAVTGFRQQSEMCDVLAASDVFAFPSRFETWGLVLNEAMVFGLAPVVSDAVTAHRDLIRPNETGATYHSGDVSELASLLRRYVDSPEARRAVGLSAREHVLGWNLERCVEGVAAALRHVGGSRVSGARGGGME